MRLRRSRLAHGRNRSASTGFSILELSVVMILTATLSVAIVVNFLLANDRHRADDTVQEVTDLVHNVHSLFGTSQNYANLSTAYIASSAQVDANFVSGTTLVDPFKGPVTIVPATTTNANDSISVTVAGLPVWACLRVAVADFGPDFISSSVGGKTSSNNAPLTPKKAVAGCNQQYNSVKLIFD